jgi:hypothetical protein
MTASSNASGVACETRVFIDRKRKAADHLMLANAGKQVSFSANLHNLSMQHTQKNTGNVCESNGRAVIIPRKDLGGFAYTSNFGDKVAPQNPNAREGYSLDAQMSIHSTVSSGTLRPRSVIATCARPFDYTPGEYYPVSPQHLPRSEADAPSSPIYRPSSPIYVPSSPKYLSFSTTKAPLRPRSLIATRAPPSEDDDTTGEYYPVSPQHLPRSEADAPTLFSPMDFQSSPVYVPTTSYYVYTPYKVV